MNKVEFLNLAKEMKWSTTSHSVKLNDPHTGESWSEAISGDSILNKMDLEPCEKCGKADIGYSVKEVADMENWKELELIKKCDCGYSVLWSGSKIEIKPREKREDFLKRLDYFGTFI